MVTFEIQNTTPVDLNVDLYFANQSTDNIVIHGSATVVIHFYAFGLSKLFYHFKNVGLMKPRSKTSFACQFIGLQVGCYVLPTITISSKSPITNEIKIQELESIQEVSILDESLAKTLNLNKPA
jgi:hypothetical protein